jgi:iron complex outermembrane receptor protein/hemoglobin/transferrin/lactoferrin receptor protein
MKKKMLSVFVAVSLLSSFTTSLHSEEVTVAGKNKKQVSRDKDSKDEFYVLDAYTVLGTGMKLQAIEYPGSVNVIGSKELSLSADIIQNLSQIVGFETGNDNGRSLGQQYTIRGFGYQSENRVIVEMDGVRRSASLYSNHISSFRADTDLLKRVEVIKGASSIIHGGGAIGGVVGMTTKDASDYILEGNDIGAVVNARYETNNLKQASIGVGYLFGEYRPDLLVYYKRAHKGDLTLSKKLEDTDGTLYDDIDNDEDLYTLFLKSGWQINESNKLSVSYMKYHEDTEVTWQSLYHNSYSSVSGPVIGDLDQDDLVATYKLTPASSDWVDLEVTAYHSEASYARGYTYVDNGSETDLFYENMDKRWGLKAKNISYFTTGKVNHRLLIGADYERRKEDATYILNGEYSDFGSMPNQYDDSGIYVQEEASAFEDKLVLQLGGRYDSFDREVKNGAEDYSNSHFSPRIGLSYECMDGLYLLANYSESFRAPTPHETSSHGPLNPHYYYMPNPDLDPETIEEYEFGVSFEREHVFSEGDAISTKLMFFTGTIYGLIDLVPDYDGPTPPSSYYYATYENVEEVDREGIEWELLYSHKKYDLSLSYETLDQKDSVTGEKTPFAFADKLKIGVSLHPFKENINFNISAEHWFAPDQNPETIVSRGVTYYYVDEAYDIVNASISWRPTKTVFNWLDETVNINVGVRNIFDDERINASNVRSSSRVGLGRNIYISQTKAF